jgi:ankyrin repeat protein
MKTFKNISLLTLLTISHYYSHTMQQGDRETILRTFQGKGAAPIAHLPEKLLIKAIENCDLQEVENLLDSGANIHVRSGIFTLLDIAAIHCDESIAAVLVERGASINERNPAGGTALMIAADRENRGVVSFLLQFEDIDVDAKDNFRNTALIYAVRANDFKITKALIEHGADVNHPGYKDKTALDIARDNNNQDMIALLQNAGAQ